MNAISVMFVNQHLDSLRAENQPKRMAGLSPKRSLRSRIAAAAASLGVTSNSDPVVPKLHDYPYGG